MLDLHQGARTGLNAMESADGVGLSDNHDTTGRWQDLDQTMGN